jgi:predicted small secreted protein
MKKLLVTVLAAVVLSACNTIAGIGKDIEAAGGAVEKSATDTKKKM